MFGFTRTCTCLLKLITWVNSLFLSPRGMGRTWDTTLQKVEILLIRTELGISGYTLDSVGRVVGERGE